MAKYYLMIETSSLVSGKIDKAASVTIEGTVYTGTVAGAMEAKDLAVTPIVKDVTFKVSPDSKSVSAQS